MRKRFIIAAAGFTTLTGIAIAAATIEPQKGGASLLDVRRWSPDWSEQDSKNLETPLKLRAPKSDDLLVSAPDPTPAPLPEGAVGAHAYQYDSRVFSHPSEHPTAIGLVRRGRVLRTDQRTSGPGCNSGAWYALRSKGYVCSRDGFAISRGEHQVPAIAPLPDLDSALPYRYGKARTNEALRFYEIPTAAELEEIAAAQQSGSRPPDVVERQMDGVFLLALDSEETRDDSLFYRTVRGRYVKAEDIELKPTPAMHGELLGSSDKCMTLPLAFVYGDEGAQLYARDKGTVRSVGKAEKHVRLTVAREARWNGRDMVVREDGIALPREHTRIARRIKRPEDIPQATKWIHVNLDEQTLVAYEGDRPVFATLVSSGKGEDFATPTGIYQIREKHISVTMNGPDPDAGYYEVEEVPWTQYYHDSFALHGAYWHNDFGKTRSHGCTNISPIDARWLFYWTDDDLPQAWHALRKLHGNHVYFTRDLPPQ